MISSKSSLKLALANDDLYKMPYSSQKNGSFAVFDNQITIQLTKSGALALSLKHDNEINVQMNVFSIVKCKQVHHFD